MEQGLEKLYHFFPSEGAPVELDVERPPLTLGRDGPGVKGVDAPLFRPHRAGGGLPLRSPGAFKVGDEQKAAFVQENHVGAKLRGFVLSVASESAANAQSLPRRADTSAARASGNSPPSSVTDTTGQWDGSAPAILSRLSWRYAAMATIPSGSPQLAPRAGTPGPSVASAPPRNRKAGRGGAWGVSPLAPTVGRRTPTPRPHSWMPSACGRWWRVGCHFSISGWLGAAASPIVGPYLGVSCPLSYAEVGACSILFTKLNSKSGAARRRV